MSDRIELARALIREARASQRGLIDRAFAEEYRTLNAEEFELHAQLDATIKAAQSELATLRDAEAVSASSARRPNGEM